MSDSLFDAVLQIQAEVKALPKSADNPFFKSKYTPLEKIVEIIQPLLTKHGLIWTTCPDTIEGTAEPALRYALIHAASGDRIEGKMPLLLQKRDAQGVGSAITYARRYTLCCVLNLVADKDDDGNEAVKDDPQDFAAQIRKTGMKGAAITAWLTTEGGYEGDTYDGTDVSKLTGDKLVKFLNTVLVPTEQEHLLRWAKGE